MLANTGDKAPVTHGICGSVHALLSKLPLYRDPASVPFANGVYVFYEDGERTGHAPEGRIVRVGTHPKQDFLQCRLWNHFTGSKHNSVFRRYVGGAILRREEPTHPCLRPRGGKGHWEKGDGISCSVCRPLERRVGDLIRASFSFRCIAIADSHLRRLIERKLIASLSACQACEPSEKWLGLYAYDQKVKTSGLWNSHHVFGLEALTEDDVRQLERLVDRTLKS